MQGGRREEGGAGREGRKWTEGDMMRKRDREGGWRVGESVNCWSKFPHCCL